MVQKINWVIDLETHGYTVFVHLLPLMKPRALREETRWIKDFRKAIFDELGERVPLVCRLISDSLWDVGYDEPIDQAFLVRGLLPFFDEWANAVLTGEITAAHLFLIPKFGAKSENDLMGALREWKKSR